MCFGLFRVRLVGFVATDHATSNSADLAVTGDRTRDTPNGCTLDASLGLGGRRKRKSENGGANDKSLHGSLQNVVLRIIAGGHLRSDSETMGAEDTSFVLSSR